jgi:hypothetical protein
MAHLYKNSDLYYKYKIMHLGVKNQLLLSHALDLGARNIARRLKQIDAELTWLLQKYSPDQPRVPAGNPDGGQWVATGGDSGATSVTENSGSSVTLNSPDGSTETRSGGSRSWRNNNPGNLRSGTFANSQGAIGSAGGFAVFPDEQTGDAASAALLRTPTYSGLSVDDAIARRSPSNENDTTTLQDTIHNMSGLSGDEIVGELDDNEMSKLTDAIKRTEGWIPGTTNVNPAP